MDRVRLQLKAFDDKMRGESVPCDMPLFQAYYVSKWVD